MQILSLYNRSFSYLLLLNFLSSKCMFAVSLTSTWLYQEVNKGLQIRSISVWNLRR